MARVTIEDCLKKVNNRFTIIEIAAKRARQIMNGTSEAMIKSNDKPGVIALREIAAGLINPEKKEHDDFEEVNQHDELAELFKSHDDDDGV